MTPQPVPKIWPWLVVSAALAAVFDLGSLHEATNGDTLVPVLASLYRWTPFFWEEDRFGLPFAWLTQPIHNPFWNLLAQTFLQAATGIGSLFLLARFLFASRAWPLIGLVTCILCFGIAPRAFSEGYLALALFYGPSIFFGLAALLLVESPGVRAGRQRWRWAPALLCTGLAHWLNFAVAYLLVLLVLFQYLFCRVRRDGGDGAQSQWQSLRAAPALRYLALITLGYAAAQTLMRGSPYYDAHRYQLSPARLWVGGFWTMLGKTDYGFGPWMGYSAVLLLVALAAGWSRPALRAEARPLWRAGLGALAASALYGFAVGTSNQAVTNAFPARYLVPSGLIFAMVMVAAGLGPVVLSWTATVRDRAAQGLGLALLVIVAARFGLPSPTAARSTIDAALGSRTNALMAARCTHVVGNYYKVWNAVFHVNLTRYERGDPAILWGLSNRSGPTRPRWSAADARSLRICAPDDDDDDRALAHGWLNAYGFGALVVVDRSDGLVVWGEPPPAQR